MEMKCMQLPYVRQRTVKYEDQAYHGASQEQSND
jgi:hypothetical protein